MKITNHFVHQGNAGWPNVTFDQECARRGTLSSFRCEVGYPD